MRTSDKSLPFRNLALAALLWCLCAGTAAAQAARIDVNALTEETQRLHPEANRMTLVWWLPEEFWQATLAEDPTITKAQAEQFLGAIRPYAMFVVVDGKIGTFGGVTYKSEEVIRSTIQVVDVQGGAHRPLPVARVDPDTKMLLSVMKPLLSNMIGKMGENMHFIIFPAKDAAGRKIADASKEGTLSLKLGADVYKWKLPLGSLLPARSCPVDGERLNGAWKFCPWHGEKLVTKP